MIPSRRDPVPGRSTVALRISLSAAVGGLCLLAVWIMASQAPTAPPRNAPQLAGMLDDRALPESSGLAPSRRSPDVLWTHNDSGDKPRLFALDRTGKLLGVSAVRGAKAIDWEDLCSMTIESRPCLLIADVGDNGSRRDHVTLYWIEEPQRPGQPADVLEKIDFRYEDGPRDCEAVGFDPAGRDVLLIEKRWTPRAESTVYRLPWPVRPDARGRAAEHALPIAKRVGTVPLTVVTAMDISADGRTCVVASYLQGRIFRRKENEAWPEALGRAGTPVTLPPRRQGEAICFSADGRSLWLTSEKLPMPLWHVPLDAPASPPDE